MNSSQKKMVWIPSHPEYEWFPGTLVDDSDEKFLRVVDNKEQSFQVERKKAIEVEPSCLDGIADLLMLNDLNEGGLLHNIRERYAKDKIYTAIGGPIIISVNPYKQLDIYHKDLVQKYKKTIGQMRSGVIYIRPPLCQNLNPHDIEPHLYRVAENAYQALLETKKSQSIIISGESGSGKTEGAKIILKYLTQTSNEGHEKVKDKQTKEYSVEDRVLDSNPILEAFGNAKTLRNDNSSRFGKFIEVYFDKTGRIKSASMVNYLLEKSRLVVQQEGERNYHIFYQICYGFTPEEKEKYMIGDTMQYRYLSRDKTEDTDYNMEDLLDFEKTRECIETLGIQDDEKDQIFRIVAGLLNLGNVDFSDKKNSMDGGSEVDQKTKTDLEKASLLLGVQSKDLATICTRKVSQVGQLVMDKQFCKEDAMKAKDGIVKDVYGKFFDWLIWRINLSISKSQNQENKDKTNLVLGILDIFGFEIFKVNSFEQLCINYTNEKLQQHFNDHIFKLEQEEYKKEGIGFENVIFIDNSKTIELIDNERNSIFSSLEEECMLPKGNDSSLVGKINKISSNSLCPRNQNEPTVFGIRHYAGEVFYDVTNFVEKNKDIVNPDIMKLFSGSQNALLKDIFSNENKFTARDLSKSKEAQRGRSASSMKAATLTAKFKSQLSELVISLNDTNPSYIRCIKPNGVKTPGIFDSMDIMRQLRCAGILEAIRIRKNGYPIRRGHQDFLKKYSKICPEIDSKSGGNAETSRAIFKKLCSSTQVAKQLNNLWALGKSKVFMKEDAVPILDHQLYLAIQKYIKKLQQFAKRIILRRKWKAWGNIIRMKRRLTKIVFRVVQRRINAKHYQNCGKIIWKNWQIYKINKRNLWRREKLIDLLAQLRQKKLLEEITQNFEAEQIGSPLKKPDLDLDSEIMKNNGDIKAVFKKLQLELSDLKRENSELKNIGGGRATGGTLGMGNVLLDRLGQHLGKEGNMFEGDMLDDVPALDAEEREKYESKIEELEKTLKEKDATIKSLNTKINYMQTSQEGVEKENAFLREEIKKREAMRQEKTKLELQIKQWEKDVNEINARNGILKGELVTYKEKIKQQQQAVKDSQDQLKAFKTKYDDLEIQYKTLQQQEEYFRMEAAKKAQEIKEKIDLLSQKENDVDGLHNKLKDMSIAQIENSKSMTPLAESKEFLSERSFGEEAKLNESDPKITAKIEELEIAVNQKNVKMFQLTKENQISKEINQTLVKLLKIKNVQIQTNKIISTESGSTREEAQKNLEKFQNEEKKLLRMLDQLMRQYDSIENTQAKGE